MSLLAFASFFPNLVCTSTHSIRLHEQALGCFITSFVDCYGVTEVSLQSFSRIGFSLPVGSDDVVGMALLIDSLSRRSLVRYGVMVRGALKFCGSCMPAYIAVEDILRLSISDGGVIPEKIKKSLPQNFPL